MRTERAKFYDENGYIPVTSVLDETETAELKRNFEILEEFSGKENTQYAHHNLHDKIPWVLRLATHPKLLEPIKEVVGENVILLDSRFICKYPEKDIPREAGVEPFVAWHQDQRYWGVDGEVISVWFAIDDSTVDNGCMKVIPGTHKLGYLEHGKADTKGNLLSANQAIPDHLYDASKAVHCPLKAGQMSLHHGLIVHGSEPNNSENSRRCGYVIRYLSTSAKPVDDPNRPRKFQSTVLVAGTNKEGNFEDRSPVWFKSKS